MAGLQLALQTFLQREAGKPHIWGVSDCGLLVADWVLASRGIDPCAHSRGRYASEQEAAAFYACWCGLARAIGRALAEAGLRRTATPQAGDVGAVVIGGHVCGAVCCGRYWAVRWMSGLVLVDSQRVRVVAAWRV